MCGGVSEASRTVVGAEGEPRVERRDPSGVPTAYPTRGRASAPAKERESARFRVRLCRGLVLDELGGHVGELERDRLVLRDGLAELDALERIVARELERRARNADGAGGDQRPRRLEHEHGADRARPRRVALLVVAETRVLGDEAV